MEDVRDEAFFARGKKNLLVRLMQTQFENRLGKLLAQSNYENMDELDRTLDAELRKYYREVELVDAYYCRFIES